MASKTIPYSSIQGRAARGPLEPAGKGRLWGTMNFRYWANLDMRRTRKSFGLILDLGKRVKPYITPDDTDALETLLREKAGLGPAGPNDSLTVSSESRRPGAPRKEAFVESPNFDHWETLAAYHGTGSDRYYDVDALVAGHDSFTDLEENALALATSNNGVEGLDVIHIQSQSRSTRYRWRDEVRASPPSTSRRPRYGAPTRSPRSPACR